MAEGSNAFHCSICLHTFKNPKLLPCSHTFCAECLESYIEKSSVDKSFTCPLCRKTLEVPDNGISGFPANYYILPTTDASLHSKLRQCDCCSGECASLFKCLQCNESYCETCTGYHRKMKGSRDHEILEISQENGQSETRIRRKTFCSIHGEEIIFVCDCNMQICLHCKLTTHQNHTSESVIVTANQIREKITENLLSDRRKQLELIQSSQKQTCCSMKQESDEREEREINKIDTRALELKSEVDQICTELKTKVKTRMDEERQNIKEKEQLAIDQLGSLELLCSTAERMVKMADDIDIVNLGRAVCKNLEECFADNTENKVTGICLAHIEFKKGDMEHETVRSVFGRISIWRKPKLVSSISLDEKYDIDGLCPVDDGCWIANTTNIISLIDSAGQMIKTVTCSSIIDSLATDTDGTMLISSFYDKTIHKYTTQGKLVDVCSSLQFEPVNMAVDSVTGNLIVCSHIGVYTVACDGRVNEIKFDDTTFKKAYGVATDDAGTVCISDWENRIVTFFDAKRKKKAAYTGTGNDKFSPHDVCYDHCGNYFVVDKFANLIHILRSDGSLEYCFSTNEDLKEHPRSVAKDNRGRLWVGFDAGHVCVYEIFN